MRFVALVVARHERFYLQALTKDRSRNVRSVKTCRTRAIAGLSDAGIAMNNLAMVCQIFAAREVRLNPSIMCCPMLSWPPSCRRAEIGGMRWDELANGVWASPASRTKNGREHLLPLPGLA